MKSLRILQGLARAPDLKATRGSTVLGQTEANSFCVGGLSGNRKALEHSGVDYPNGMFLAGPFYFQREREEYSK